MTARDPISLLAIAATWSAVALALALTLTTIGGSC
jgi:hypothetical protein